MTWKNGRTTNRLPKWGATEVWGIIGISAAAVVVGTALYYLPTL